MATGRSDYPNQINNVIGFRHIFRGALDTQAKAINEEMKNQQYTLSPIWQNSLYLM